MSTQPYPQQSYPMETYPEYRQAPTQPYQPPQRGSSGLKNLAEVGIVSGIILCIGGVGAMMIRVCTYDLWGDCYEWGYPYTGVGTATLVFGIVVLVLSVVMLMFSHQQEATPQQPLSVGSPCPTCNRPMTWIPAYKRWFCQYCQRYA